MLIFYTIVVMEVILTLALGKSSPWRSPERIKWHLLVLNLIKERIKESKEIKVEKKIKKISS